MIGLHTPREVLFEMLRAVPDAGDIPEGGIGLLKGVRLKLIERGLIDMPMTASAVEALIDETLEALIEADEATRKHVASFESHRPL